MGFEEELNRESQIASAGYKLDILSLCRRAYGQYVLLLVFSSLA